MSPNPAKTHSNSADKIKLVSDDLKEFFLDRACIPLVGIFTDIVGIGTAEAMPLPSITSPVLEKLIEWLESHKSLLPKKLTTEHKEDETNAPLGDVEFDDDCFVEEPIGVSEDHASLLEAHLRFEETRVPNSVYLSPADLKFFDSLDLGMLIELTKVTLLGFIIYWLGCKLFGHCTTAGGVLSSHSW